MPEKVGGWTIIPMGDGSSVVTKDGVTNYLVTLDGCSCGKAKCVHQKAVFPVPPPPPRPPAVQSPLKHIGNGVPDIGQNEPFRLPKNNIAAGWFVVCAMLTGILKVLGYVCSAIADAINPMGDKDGTV